MGIKIKPGDLAIEISAIYDQYSDEVVKALPDITKKAAKVAKDSLKANAPSKTGEYKDSFTSKTTQNSSSISIEVYSKKPGLPHLLEYGHVIKNQYGVYGRTSARPHWAPAEEAANEEFEKQLQKKMEEIG